jgi:hypothetical protein
MANYAIIEDNKVINVIVADSAELAAEVTGKEVTEATDGLWIDWTRIDGVWSRPVEPEVIIEPEPEVTE